MNSLKIKAIVVVLLCLLFTKTNGQAPELKIQIGKPLPDFSFSSDDHRQTNLITNKDIKGKHTILYYWNKGCTACIKHFVNANDLQQKYKDRLNIISVGLNFKKTDSNIKKVYEIYEKKWNLGLTSVYDTTFAIRNGIEDLPVIWVDDKGIVRAYNSSVSVTERNIDSFLADNVALEDNLSKKDFEAVQKEYDEETPLMVNGNGGIEDNNFLFRSALGKWKYGMVVSGNSMGNLEKRQGVEGNNRYRVEFAGVTMPLLFYAVLTGLPASNYGVQKDDYTLPIFEGNIAKKIGLDSLRFFYSLAVPDSTFSRDKIQKYVLQDLRRYFDCTATIEKRLLPCWVIKAKKGALDKLQTRRGKEGEKFTQISAELNNKPFSRLLQYLETWCLGRSHQKLKGSEHNFLRIYNGSEIPDDYPVDLVLKTTRVDSPEHINQELKKYGLSIVRENRLQNALVIKDVEN